MGKLLGFAAGSIVGKLVAIGAAGILAPLVPTPIGIGIIVVGGYLLAND